MPHPKLRWVDYDVNVHPQSTFATFSSLQQPAARPTDTVEATITLPDLSGYLSPREKAEALLSIAAEVEHALLVQYLYAAYSLSDGTGLTPERKKAVGLWRDTIVEIAKEEMGHLMSVQNLRRVLDLGPTFDRNEFPMLPDLFPFRFDLGPLKQKSLAEYVVAESPPQDTTHPELGEIIKEATGCGTIPINRVGNLYGLLGVIFAASLQDINNDAAGGDSWYVMVKEIAGAAYQQNPSPAAWHLHTESFDATTLPQQANPADFGLTSHSKIHLFQCANRSDAKSALRDIGLQGEGPAQPPPPMPLSHFERFYAIYTGGQPYLLPFPHHSWVPTYAAPRNPVVSDNVQKKNAITEPKAQAYATLGNLRYALVLGLLNQYLVIDPALRASLKFTDNLTISRWALKEMLSLSDLATTLAGLPRSIMGPAVGNAALPFKLPAILTPPVAVHDQWKLLIKRLEKMIDVETCIVDQYNDQQVQAARDTHLQQLDVLKQQFATAVGEVALVFADVQRILENAVNGDDIGEHGKFWDTTLDNFKSLVLFQGTPLEKQVLIVGDGANSNLIKALRGQTPFDGTYANQMPDGYPYLDDDTIDQISAWIDGGCN